MARVVTVTPLAIDTDSRGYKLAASLARSGHESIVLEGMPSSRLDRSTLPFELITAEGAETVGSLDELPAEPSAGDGDQGGRDEHSALGEAARSVAEAPLVMHGYLRQFRRLTRRSLPPAPLYYLQGYWQYLAVQSRCREQGSRFLYDIRDLYWGEGVNNPFRSRLTARLMEAVEKRCAARAIGMTTVSDGLADGLEARFGRRPTVIRNSHDLRLDEPVDRGLRETLGLPAEVLLLVAVGNAKFGTTFDQALDAVAGLPEHVHLAFVGGGFAPYMERIERRSLGERVHVVSPVAPTQISAFIASADIALLLYREADRNFVNALPNRFFHSVAAGLPLLYPPLWEIAKLAAQYELGIEVHTEDPASIAAAVRRLAEDRALLDRYRANSARARDELSWEREESVMNEVVEEALGARGERRYAPRARG